MDGRRAVRRGRGAKRQEVLWRILVIITVLFLVIATFVVSQQPSPPPVG